MKALVTGANGFIGSNLCKELLKRNFQVYVLLRKKTSIGYKKIEDIMDKLNIIYYEDILYEGYRWNKYKDFDFCFNLASYGVDYRKQNIDKIIDGNVVYTINLLKFLKKVGIGKVINVGSCFEYGNNHGEKIKEDHNINPQSLYSAAKASMIIVSKAYAKNLGIKLITARPFGVFGEGEGIHKLIPQVIMSCIKNTELKLTGGEQVRDYMYIKDLINGFIELAIRDVSVYEEFNVCSSTGIKLKDLILKISEISNVDKKLFIFGGIPYRKDEVMYFIGDNTKLKKYTKWETKYSLEDGLYNTYIWYKKKYEKENKYE